MNSKAFVMASLVGSTWRFESEDSDFIPVVITFNSGGNADCTFPESDSKDCQAKWTEIGGYFAIRYKWRRHNQVVMTGSYKGSSGLGTSAIDDLQSMALSTRFIMRLQKPT